MNPILFEAGGVLAAAVLIGYSITSFFSGAAHLNGAAMRESIKPVLESVRANSDKSRSELADASLMIGVACAVAAVLLESAMFGCILAIGLIVARKTVQQVTSSEHPLMSLGAQFSADLVIGVVVPMSLAHVLMGNWLLAGAQLALSVSLSWPTGGPGRRVGEWKPSRVGA